MNTEPYRLRALPSHLLFALALALALTGCGDDGGGGADAGVDVGAETGDDVAAETGTDVLDDVVDDVGDEVTDDAGGEVSEDTAGDPDIADVVPDLSGDAEPDAGGDSGADAGLDAVADSGNDVGRDVADAAPDASIAWSAPDCVAVTGSAAVTFTDDEGATLALTAGTLSGIAYTYGLVAQPDVPGLLYAEHQGDLLRSTDAGCTWTRLDEVDRSPLRLTAGVGAEAWAWSDNGEYLYRVDAGGATRVREPTTSILGVGTGTCEDRDGAQLPCVVVGGADGQLYESIDGGESFTAPFGPPREVEGLGYRVAFDPADVGHAFFGCAGTGSGDTGGWVTFDHGATWTAADGLSAGIDAAARANVFEIVVSPADPDTVWAAAIDIYQTLPPNDGQPHGGRHLYLSRDGGLTFAVVVDNREAIAGSETTVTLRNQPTMAAHPTDADVLYFVFGTYFDGYGTDLYRYDADGDVVSFTHNGNDDVNALAFNPGAPEVIYLGLTEESGITF
jgi:hypothetical protein